MTEQFWSETGRMMDLAADCRATVAKTRAVVDHSWSILHQVVLKVDDRRLRKAPSAEQRPLQREKSPAGTAPIAIGAAAEDRATAAAGFEPGGLAPPVGSLEQAISATGARSRSLAGGLARPIPRLCWNERFACPLLQTAGARF